jgi:hypothetical protein
MTRPTLALAAALLAAPATALADEPAPDPAPTTTEIDHEDMEEAGSVAYTDVLAVSAGSVRANASGWVIMPEGWETSGELRFLTSDSLKMTDVVVAHAGVRKSLKGKAEIGAGVDVLPKQETDTDENVFQGIDVSALYGIGQKSAFGVTLAGGPLQGREGVWTGSGFGLQRRSRVHDTLSFQLGLGGSVTNLAFSDSDDRALLGEVTAGVRTLFMLEDAFGLWFSGAFAFPVVHSGTLMGGAEFDPQTRVDVSVGLVYALVEKWDVYMQLGVIDRGDVEDPATTMPILQGGADQKVFTFGITRHFGQDDSGDYDYIALE